MFRIQHLPYEVLRCIFDCLDRKSLLDAALTSRAINELASRRLYASVRISVGRLGAVYGPQYHEIEVPIRVRNPFDAFARQPELRQIVKHIILYNPLHSHSYNGSVNVKHEAVCFRELALLNELQTITIDYDLKRSGFDLLVESLSNLPRLQEVEWRVLPPNSASLQRLSNVNRFSIWLKIGDDVLSRSCMTTRICKITAIGLPEPIADEKLLSLPGLRELSGGVLPHTLPQLCSSLGTAVNLTHLEFGVNLHHFKSKPFVPGRSSLTKLVKLTVNIETAHFYIDTDYLSLIVDGLASESHLRELSLNSIIESIPPLSSPKLVAQVIRTHQDSLETLKLPIFTVSKGTMIQMLSGLPLLTYLWIATTRGSQTWIGDVLLLSVSLKTLVLLDHGFWPISSVKSLLYQASRNLSVVEFTHTHRLFLGKKLTWKTYWEYNLDFELPVRRIQVQEKE